MKTAHLTNRRAFFRDIGTTTVSFVGLANGWARLATGQESPANATAQVATGGNGVVATVHPLASRAAIAAFERGGNAIDAAIAASLMLSVVDGHNSGIGGGCLALIRKADGTIIALDGRETAPERAKPEMFFRNGQPAPELSQLGPLAAGVPGLLAVLHQLSHDCGRISWQESLFGAADVAENGFHLSENFARVLSSAADELRKFPASAQIYLDSSGSAWRAGHLLRQADLSRTLRSIGEQGVEWFYQGEFAAITEKTMRDVGGVLQAGDFANYKAIPRQPIQTSYRNHSIIGFPPPSSGGIHNAQMLGMLADFDVAGIFAESQARGTHLLLEVMKRAMADRAFWLGDADFTKVPLGLLDPDYLRMRASSIDLGRATAVDSHGQPPRADLDLFGKQRHTTHLTTADAAGNVVAITQTVNTSFGCKMIVPGTGVVLNNEMDDFSIAPGVRNAFGLVGSAANIIAPGKRPLSSMSPTLVLDEAGRARLSCGAAGGPKIISAVQQVLVRMLDLNSSINEALAAPRVHHQWSPDQAVCERALDDRIVDELESMGHKTSRIGSAAVAQGLAFVSGKIIAASDPRVPSSALGF